MKLWHHQQLAVEKARTNRHLALLLETGTGKTAAMIEILKEECGRKPKQNILIFAPLTVCKQWASEVQKFWPDCQYPIHVMTGSGKARSKRMDMVMGANHSCIIITNYEGLRITEFYVKLLQWVPSVLVCDEAHRLKDPNSLQSKKMYPLALCSLRRFILTGTPILNSMLDIFGQYKVLDTGHFGQNFFVFRAKHFYDKNAGMPKQAHFPDWRPKPGADKMISEVLSRTSVQAKKDECLDLPPLHRIKIPVDLSQDQIRAYKEMEKTCVAQIKDELVISEFAMTKTLRLQQLLCGYLPNDDGEIVWLDQVPRYVALREQLDAIGPFNKTIIWTTFRATYARIAEVCQGLGRKYAMLTGDQSILEKERSIEAFCKRDTQVLIANPQAGGVGVNLTEANYAIYFSKGYNLEHYLQSEARNYRGGSEMFERITHYHFVATGTLDEVINEALLAKQNVGERILQWAKRLSVPGEVH